MAIIRNQANPLLAVEEEVSNVRLNRYDFLEKGPHYLMELLGVLPPADCIDKFTMKCIWIQETFSHLPQDANEETIRKYVKAYVMMLLPTQLFSDKYSWGSAPLLWLYQYLCHVANRNVVKLAGSLRLLQSWIFLRFLGFRPDRFDVSCGLRTKFRSGGSSRDPRVPTYGTMEGCDGIDLLCCDRMALGEWGTTTT
ncbi:hypothetical protein Ahy_A01g000538 [Arachis hypogaea]|uniref:Aminotransferase-like plant mobile domain-containing protein n=1 Tax=Arachis hypogaea TaxID=3818 RepID=A0A445EKG8_ARAHY|nr:hypothetical protein Ahy_A01g000538 [Arachis hypogaea]